MKKEKPKIASLIDNPESEKPKKWIEINVEDPTNVFQKFHYNQHQKYFYEPPHYSKDFRCWTMASDVGR